MGFQVSKRPLKAPSYALGRSLVAKQTTAMNVDISLAAATNGVRFGRLVRVKTDGSVIPTTGTSGRSGIGITLSSASSGSQVQIRVWGIVPAVASSAAIAKGAYLRGTSGASTGVNAGCVKTSTGAAINSVFGLALSSAAAAAVSTSRTVNVLITQQGQTLI